MTTNHAGHAARNSLSTYTPADQDSNLADVRAGRGQYVIRPVEGRRKPLGGGSRGKTGALVASPDRPVANPLSRVGSDFVSVRRYNAPNWATTDGVMRKRRAIERKGLPSFAGWKFVTLTLNRDKCKTPLEGYLRGKARMAKFLYLMRQEGFILPSDKWAWKLEFHKDGWPHWHLLVGHKAWWPKERLPEIDDLWSLGQTNTEEVKTHGFLYTFKYAFKPVLNESAHDDFATGRFCLPDWFMDYVASRRVVVKWEVDGHAHEADADKPVSFGRIRFWQTSRGFYTKGGKGEDEKPEKKPVYSCYLPLPPRTAADRADRVVQVIARGRNGDYDSSAVIVLDVPFWNLTRAISWEILAGEAHGLSVGHYVCSVHIINKYTSRKWQIQKVAKLNSLHPALCEQLQDRHWRIY